MNEMISYDSLSYLSDAFIEIEDLQSHIELVVEDKYTTRKISLEKYTAGSTNNPDNYKLPDFDYILEQKGLSEINPFNALDKSKLLLRVDKDYQEKFPIIADTKTEVPDEEAHLYSSESLEMMRFFENNILELMSFNSYDHSQLVSNSSIQKCILFVLNERYFQSENTYKADDNENLEFSFPANSNAKETIIENNTNNLETNNYNISQINEQDINNFINNNEINLQNNTFKEYNGKDVTYKSNITSKFKSVKFSIQNITKNYITEVRNEIIQEVESMINVINNRIQNESVTRIEINNIKNEIINNFERKIETFTKSAFDQYEAKNKAEIKDMFQKFLNS